MKTNRSSSLVNQARLRKGPRTHGGGPGRVPSTLEAQLERRVATCMLWEPTFYESGDEIALDILSLVSQLASSPGGFWKVGNMAVNARGQFFNLRHVPLFLAAAMAALADTQPEDERKAVSQTISDVIQRADELAEFLAIYAKINGIGPDELRGNLSTQVKKGLAKAFNKFNEYHFSKYDRREGIRIRDVMFLVHPKPLPWQVDLFNKIANDQLPPADTWEVALSTGKDKKATFERLLSENKLGDLALLRNLRLMSSVGVGKSLIREALNRSEFKRVLPFRFFAAAAHAPEFEPELDRALRRAGATLEPFGGTTGILVDVSGSMDSTLSERSDLTRIDAAAALAALVREVGDEVLVSTFSDKLVSVPPRHGMALRDAIRNSQPHRNTHLYGAVQTLATHPDWKKADRVIIITDEQATDKPTRGALARVGKKGYIINVAPYKVEVFTRGHYTHINGFSERVLDFIRWDEANPLTSAE